MLCYIIFAEDRCQNEPEKEAVDGSRENDTADSHHEEELVVNSCQNEPEEEAVDGSRENDTADGRNKWESVGLNSASLKVGLGASRQRAILNAETGAFTWETDSGESASLVLEHTVGGSRQRRVLNEETGTFDWASDSSESVVSGTTTGTISSVIDMIPVSCVQTQHADAVSDADSEDNACCEISTATSPETVVVNKTNNCGSRKCDKKYHCVYCGEEFAQLPRHMYSQHAEEQEVVQVVATTDPVKRKQLLDKLRNLGGHKHNVSVIREGKGTLDVVYRPSIAGTDSCKYVPCQYCYGYYGRRQLWRHVRQCPLRPCKTQEESAHAGKWMRPVRASDQILSAINCSSDSVNLVMSDMHKDAVFMVIKNDSLIHELARKLMSRAGHSVKSINNVRARLRKVGRVLLQIRKNNASLRSATVRTVISPTLFKTVVGAAKEVCHYNSDTYKYGAPSTAVHLGHDLRACATFLKSMAAQEPDLDTERKAQSFAELVTSDWNYEISGAARRDMQAKKFNNPQLLPLTADVMKLTTHLKDVQTEHIVSVRQKAYDGNFIQSFRMLADATLAQLILFNRRRQGEVSRLTVHCYTSNANVGPRFAEVEDCLSPVEKKLCSFFTRIELAGKRNNCVPLLLTDGQKEIIGYLVDQDLRQHAGISEANPYVFALGKGSLMHVRGHDALRYFSQNCDAVRPELLRSSAFRKHLATMSQVLNLKRHELDQIAKFMGHDVRVHREFYRLPADVIQTARVVRVLMSMENGTVAQFRGKSLEEIDVADHFGKSVCFCGVMLHKQYRIISHTYSVGYAYSFYFSLHFCF